MRSAALALVLASPDSTSRPMRPHRSASQVAFAEAELMMRLFVVAPMIGPVVAEGLDSVRETCEVTVGHHCARACSAIAAAARTCASAAATVWLETSTCSTSWSSCGSLKIVHHLPRSAASRGAACCQAPASPPFSLYAAGTSTSGRL